MSSEKIQKLANYFEIKMQKKAQETETGLDSASVSASAVVKKYANEYLTYLNNLDEDELKKVGLKAQTYNIVGVLSIGLDKKTSFKIFNLDKETMSNVSPNKNVLEPIYNGVHHTALTNLAKNFIVKMINDPDYKKILKNNYVGKPEIVFAVFVNYSIKLPGV